MKVVITKLNAESSELNRRLNGLESTNLGLRQENTMLRRELERIANKTDRFCVIFDAKGHFGGVADKSSKDCKVR